jgi:hypothetical protein
MYPFYVNDKRVFSFSYKPRKGGVVKDDDTGKWYEILRVDEGRGRKAYGKKTVSWDDANWRPM